MKTLLGKNNYLFLINDTHNSLNTHINNIKTVNLENLNKYKEYINNKNILLVVFPDKEYICKNFLPFN